MLEVENVEKKNLSTNRFTEIRAYKSKKKKKKKVKWIQWKKDISELKSE